MCHPIADLRPTRSLAATEWLDTTHEHGGGGLRIAPTVGTRATIGTRMYAVHMPEKIHSFGFTRSWHSSNFFNRSRV